MPEVPAPTDMQTRLEHSRSIEDAEHFRALDTLRQVGLLVLVSDLETYHGRLGRNSDESAWQVDPSFSNGGDDSGNYNVNNRPTLYTGEEEIAREFAEKRYRERLPCAFRQEYDELVNGRTVDWREAVEQFRVEKEEDFRVEVHDITSADPDATVIDFSFDDAKLSDDDKVRYKKALKALLIPITEGSPVGFEHRDEVQPFAEAAKVLHKGFLTTEDVATIVAESGIDEATANQLAGAYNVRQIAAINPSYLVRQLIKNRNNIVTDELDVGGGEKQEVPLNFEYVERYLRLAHIVGAKRRVDSATLGRYITPVSFIDLERTKTKETHEAERRTAWHKLGSAAAALSELLPAEVMPRDQLHALLQDAHAKPEKLVAAARSIEGYDAIFNADTGNWEGFTLSEHTETVLRNFDENFADKIPVEFLAPMRLAILSHDVGKPVAAANGEKHLQKKYNALQADDFLTKAGVNEQLKGILLAVISEGADLAHRIYIRGAGEEVGAQLENLARNTLNKFRVDGERVKDQIAGFVEMCMMLQICDGGAYTSMATTNRGNPRGRHRNAPSFNDSFAQPVGLGKRTIALRKNGDVPTSSF